MKSKFKVIGIKADKSYILCRLSDGQTIFIRKNDFSRYLEVGRTYFGKFVEDRLSEWDLR